MLRDRNGGVTPAEDGEQKKGSDFASLWRGKITARNNFSPPSGCDRQASCKEAAGGMVLPLLLVKIIQS